MKAPRAAYSPYFSRARGCPSPQNCLFPQGIRVPNRHIVLLFQLRPYFKRHLEWFSPSVTQNSILMTLCNQTMNQSINQSINQKLYAMVLCMSVCLSVTNRGSIDKAERINMVFLYGRFFDLLYIVL